MSVNLPSKSAIVFIWIILMIYLAFNFFKKPSDIFFQMSYDWENVSILDSIGEVAVDSVSFDFLVLKNDLKRTQQVSTNNSYKLITPKTVYYFRVSDLIMSENNIVFSGVRWINGYPEKELKTAKLEIIDLPLKEDGNKTVVTIGDSEMIWQEGRDLRKWLHLKNQDLVFLGSKKDVNGFAHEATVYATAGEILNRLDEIPTADVYVLFFGAQDKATDPALLKDQVCQVISRLSSRAETKKLIAVSLPPSNNPGFEQHNSAFNNILKECTSATDKSVLIPLYDRLKEENNYLMDDGVHLNQQGYSILVKLLDKSLE